MNDNWMVIVRGANWPPGNRAIPPYRKLRISDDVSNHQERL